MKYLLNVLLFMPILVRAQSLTISTIAGTHVMGYSGNGGPALSANLNHPHKLVVDTAGNVYIAEMANNVVRKISKDSVITVVAGTHTAGFSGDGGPAILAKLNLPSGVCLDKAGNLYISELQGSRVRKVDTAGIITTYAGGGALSGDSVLATAAALNGPYAIVCDTANNLYIADGYNKRVRKVDAATHKIRTIAGTGVAGFSGDGDTATKATMNMPMDIAIDKVGNLYIDDMYNNAIRKVDTAGIITTVAGTGTSGYSGDGGPATAAKLAGPYAIGVDAAGDLYISDYDNQVIRKVNDSGVIHTIAGTGVAGYSGDGGPALSAQINNVAGIAFDVHGNIFMADYSNNVVRKMVAVSAPVTNEAVSVTAGGSVVFVIAPNPAANNIQISCSQPIEQICIKDITGRVVYNATAKANSMTVDITTLAAGMYCAIINGREVKRFVKE